MGNLLEVSVSFDASDENVITAAAMEQALGAGAAVLAGEVKSRLKSGPLREAVQTTVKVDASGGVGIVDFASAEQAFVARMLEFGHLEVTHGPGRRVVGHVPAHPFLRPSVDAAKEQAVEAFGQALATGIEGSEGQE